MRVEGLGKLKNSNDIISNRTRDFPACSLINKQIDEMK
jgi:hypothetical protein